MQDAHAVHETKHASPVLILAILAIATVIEVGLSLIGGVPRSFLVPMLIAITVVKAGLVAAYFMHLRYEKPIYTAVFLAPLAFGLFLAAVLLPRT